MDLSNHSVVHFNLKQKKQESDGTQHKNNQNEAVIPEAFLTLTFHFSKKRLIECLELARQGLSTAHIVSISSPPPCKVGDIV